MDDAEQFRGVKAAFDTIGLDEASQMEVGSLTEISKLELLRLLRVLVVVV